MWPLPGRNCVSFYRLGLITSPGSNTPQDTNCTATCPLSRKLFKLDEPDMQDTAGEEVGTNSLEMYSYGSPHMAAQKQDDQHEHTFSSYVRIQDVVLKTYLGRWTIGRSGERGSGISVLPARYDDDDDDIYIYIYIHIGTTVLADEQKLTFTRSVWTPDSVHRTYQ